MSIPLMDVHKFGGSSLVDGACLSRLTSIIKDSPACVVVSAMGDATAQLQGLLDMAIQGQPYDDTLGQWHASVDQLISSTLSCDAASSLEAPLSAYRNELNQALQHVAHTRQCDDLHQDAVLSIGELCTAAMVSAYLTDQGHAVACLDASHVLVVNKKDGDVTIDWPTSEANLADFLAKHQRWDVLVATGFIAADQQGHRVTLGLNSSDYSAAIFAALCQSTSLTLWTDVDGIMSADPVDVPAAFVLPQLSYKEALELAYFGASVLHPLVVPLMQQRDVPIHIKNSFQPALPGTVITHTSEALRQPVKGLTSMTGMAMISIEGAGMIGVSGIAARAFSALYQERISVVLISQASSEYSLCLSVKQANAEQAQQVLSVAFSDDLERGYIDRVRVDTSCAILAIVGDGMIGYPGIAAKLCAALSQSRVNIRAMAQGCSERNVSIVLEESELPRALRAVHSTYHLSSKPVSIGLIGPGQIGQAFLAQLSEVETQLRDDHDVAIQLRGIMNSSTMLLDSSGVALNDWQTAFADCQQAPDWSAWLDQVNADDMPHAVLIDTTASQSIAERYPEAIRHGMHIITPNKRANSGDWSLYQDIQHAVRETHRQYFYEATVCAGLPVIHTLQDILNTGDRVESITGVFSGTLGYIFCLVGQGCAFSTAVRQAHDAGYTEPDPRDDLSGMDVARKTICLARELGWSVVADELSIESLVPDDLCDVSVDEFLDKLPQYDEALSSKLSAIQQNDAGVHYMGSITQQGEVTVGLSSYAAGSPFASLEDTDNIVMINTRRYCKRPLVIQGPGAGAEVTAAGVFADFLRLMSSL